MKVIATLLITGFLLSISPIKPMEQKPTDSKGFQVVARKGKNPRNTTRPREARSSQKPSASVEEIKRAQPRDTTAPHRRSTSIPEVDKLIQITLAMQKQTSDLLEQQASTQSQLVELVRTTATQKELLQTQQEQLRAQGEQIVMLVALVQKFNTNLLPSDLLDDSSSDKGSPSATATASNPIMHSTLVAAAQSFVPAKLRDGSAIPDWEDTYCGPNQPPISRAKAWDSPNHPRMSESMLTHNPWESPNHPRK